MNTTADATFGPQLRGHFDFTLLFEQSIFSVGQSAILLPTSLFRITVLTRRKPSFEASTLLWIKLVKLSTSDAALLLTREDCRIYPFWASVGEFGAMEHLVDRTYPIRGGSCFSLGR